MKADARTCFRVLLARSLSLFSLLVFSAGASGADWPMFGRDKTRNPVSPEQNAPIHWDIKTGENIKWKAKIGSITFAAPVVANGLVWIGTNNDNPRDPNQPGLAGVLMCFRESDGKFLYQHVSPARQGPTYRQTWSGISCSPLIEGDRLWFVNTSAEVLCLDIGPLHRGDGLPIELWKLDLMNELSVFPRTAVMGGGGLCSIGPSYRDMIYVITGNGTDWAGSEVPTPLAPALVCLNKDTGKVIWEDNSPRTKILFGEWGSPLVLESEGRAQVIAPQGDGWIRSFDALTGELIWKFDINRKDAKNIKWQGTRGFFSTAPVFHGNRIYIAMGTYREFGEQQGRLVCLDPTKKGDISLELDDGPAKGKPNPNAGAVWHFDGIKRTMSTLAIHDGLVIAPDLSGFVHCLDADTGRTNWTHDMRAFVLSSPLIAHRKVYVADEDGKINILALSKEKQLLGERVFDSWIYSAPIFANDVLYVAAGETLFAIEEKSGSWPQWRGPDRSNASLETGLLKEWPTNGPPMLWKVTGLGEGIASVSVAGGSVYTLTYKDGHELAIALSAQSGETFWASHLGPAVAQSATMRWLSQRAPTVDDDRLYAMSAAGELVCLRTSTGEKLWQKSYTTDFLAKRRIWGFCDYPLVDGEKLICSPVGSEATLVALDKRSGEVIWKANVPGDDQAGYAATVVTEAGGVRHYVVFLSKSLVGISADDGRVLWRYDRSMTRTASSYTPIVQGENIFSPNGYGGGMALIKIVRGENTFSAEQQYHQSFNFNAFQDATVHVGDHVYAFQAPGQPVCIELKTGTLAWGPITGETQSRAALTYADGHLYIRRANGQMVLAQVTPRNYTEKGSFQIPGREEALGVTTPVVAGGRLYLRDNSRLLCYDVSAGAIGKPRTEPKTFAISLPATQPPSAEAASPRTGRNRTPDAIFVPTPEDIVAQMLELAKVKKEDLVVALGSGDGRIAIAAARNYGSRAIGYEIDPRLVTLSRENVQVEKLETLVRIEHEDIFEVNWRNADVIMIYLPSPLLQRLLPQFEKLKSGTRIVSHQFDIPGLQPVESKQLTSKEDGDMHRLFLWTIPFNKTSP